MFQVAKPRALVEIKAAVTRGLLFGEAQWVGLIIKPLSYSLEGARVHISTGPNLQFFSDQTALLEVNKVISQADADASSMTEVMDAVKSPGAHNSHIILENGDTLRQDDHASTHLQMKDGTVELPGWASMVTSVLWIQVKAESEGNLCSHFSGDPHLFSPPSSPRKLLRDSSDPLIQDSTTASVANGPPVSSENSNTGQHGYTLSNGNLPTSRYGMKTLKVKMAYGVSRSRLYERYRSCMLRVLSELSIS